ncbi:hypothetical protein MKX01_010695 [Papaver californicum]|nr:hypothetical protein MKX01_010695 [Papaver californicum]
MRFGLELLGNVCGAGEEHQAAVWFRLFLVLFKDGLGKDCLLGLLAKICLEESLFFTIILYVEHNWCSREKQ